MIKQNECAVANDASARIAQRLFSSSLGKSFLPKAGVFRVKLSDLPVGKSIINVCNIHVSAGSRSFLSLLTSLTDEGSGLLACVNLGDDKTPAIMKVQAGVNHKAFSNALKNRDSLRKNLLSAVSTDNGVTPISKEQKSESLALADAAFMSQYSNIRIMFKDRSCIYALKRREASWTNPILMVVCWHVPLPDFESAIEMSKVVQPTND